MNSQQEHYLDGLPALTPTGLRTLAKEIQRTLMENPEGHTVTYSDQRGVQTVGYVHADGWYIRIEAEDNGIGTQLFNFDTFAFSTPSDYFTVQIPPSSEVQEEAKWIFYAALSFYHRQLDKVAEKLTDRIVNLNRD